MIFKILNIAILGLLLTLSSCTVYRANAPYHGRGHSPAPSDKVTVCHKGKKTISVSGAAVDAHLKHGDYLGPCR